MQFQVPQFIETEDKIVGPLSLRQFFYIGIGGGISALLYFILQTWLWAIFSVLAIGSSVAFAFVKIQGRPLTRVVASAFNFYWKPQTYVWQPEHPVMTMKKEEETPVQKPKKVIPGFSLEKIAAGSALHASWASLQTGERMSSQQFTDEKMYGRYQIFKKAAGDQRAARRVDYR